MVSDRHTQNTCFIVLYRHLYRRCWINTKFAFIFLSFHFAHRFRNLKPNRKVVLCDFKNNLTTFRFHYNWKALTMQWILLFVSHCISQWGYDFRPAYRELGVIRDIIPNIPLLAMTATATTQVRYDIRQTLGLPNPLEVVTSFDRPNLEFIVHRKSTAWNDLRQWVRIKCFNYIFIKEHWSLQHSKTFSVRWRTLAAVTLLFTFFAKRRRKILPKSFDLMVWTVNRTMLAFPALSIKQIKYWNDFWRVKLRL